MNIRLLVCASLLIGCLSLSANAQSIRYMDESGNINFVDNIYQVPPKFRDQVLVPTPAPTGRPRPAMRPTRTPKPTKVPDSKKVKKETKKKAKAPSNPLFSNFPGQQKSEPGQVPVETPNIPLKATTPRPPGLRAPSLPILSAPPPNVGVPPGVLAPTVAVTPLS